MTEEEELREAIRVIAQTVKVILKDLDKHGLALFMEQVEKKFNK